MNKLKVYISPTNEHQRQLQKQQQQQLEKNLNSTSTSNYQHEYNADLINKNISNTIKKFSSERSLFFSNLNDAINDCNQKWMGEEQAIRFKDESTTMSRPRREVVAAAAAGGATVGVEGPVRLRRNEPGNLSCKMPSGGRASMIVGEGGSGGGNRWKALLRRCKSSKNLFQTGFMGNHSSEKAAGKEEKPPSFRKTDNLDEFDKNYLFSGNRKNIVKELRKNFEGPSATATTATSSSSTSTSTPVEVQTNKIEIKEHEKTKKVNKCSTGSGTDPAEPQTTQQNITRKARRFFEIFSSGKHQNLKSQKSKEGSGDVLKKTNNKDMKANTVAVRSSVMCEISTQTMEDDLMEPFYLHDKYGAQSRRNLNSVFYGAGTSSTAGTSTTADETQDSLDEDQAGSVHQKVSPTSTQSSLLRSKVMEKYGDRMRESESFSKFLSHATSPTPKLKAVTKIDPEMLHKPRNNTLNLYGPRRNSTSNLDDLQRCNMIIENDFESMPPPLNPTLQQQYLEAAKKQLPTATTTTPQNNRAPPEKNLLAPPKVNNIAEEDLYMLNNNKTRKFAHIKSDSANNVSDFDVELRGEVDDFVDPKWCSYTSINSGFGHASFYRQFGKIRKVIKQSTHLWASSFYLFPPPPPLLLYVSNAVVDLKYYKQFYGGWSEAQLQEA